MSSPRRTAKLPEASTAAAPGAVQAPRLPSLREMNRQRGYHRAGDPDHIPERCPDCAPALLAAARQRMEEKAGGATAQKRIEAGRTTAALAEAMIAASSLVPTTTATAATPPPQLAPLEAPRVCMHNEHFQVLATTLSPDQARALWAQLGAALDEQGTQKQARQWNDLRTWLDTGFTGAVQVRYRDNATRKIHLGMAIPDGRAHILVRTGIYSVARVRKGRSSGNYSGPVLAYSPGALGSNRQIPDAKTITTTQRITVPAADAIKVCGALPA